MLKTLIDKHLLHLISRNNLKLSLMMQIHIVEDTYQPLQYSPYLAHSEKMCLQFHCGQWIMCHHSDSPLSNY